MELHSDQERTFEPQMFQKVCETPGITKPETRSVYIPLIMMAYRSALHETTVRTPASMTFANELRLWVTRVRSAKNSK